MYPKIINLVMSEQRFIKIHLNLDKLHYYLFIISMNRCNGSFNSIEDPFGRICVPKRMKEENTSKTKDPCKIYIM